MKRILIVLLLACLSPALGAAPELKGSPSELSSYLLEARKMISINGEGEEKVEADRAVITLTIKNEARSLDNALQENDQIQMQVSQALLAGGIPADRIKAANFTSTPDYGWLKEKPKSYEISRDIRVTIVNAVQMHAIAGVVDNFREVFMGAMNFEDSARQVNELKAMQKALENIQARKALYEKTFSVSLDLVKVMERPVFIAAPQVRKLMKADTAVSVSRMRMPGESMEPAPVTDSFAGITYHANVTAEFEIRP